MSTLPTGNVTFFFTDLEGSTHLWETFPDAMRVDLARHDALLNSLIVQHGGRVFKTVGDAFCAVFLTAPAALQAALAAQQSLQTEPWTVGTPGLRARMALHTGEVQAREGDYFGPALHRTARLRDIAHGGQTVLSQATEQCVRSALPSDVSLRDLGSHRLKDLLRPEQVFQIDHPTLPGDFPALRSLNRFPHNLPHRLDGFVGRERELAQIGRMLTASRLVTLTGVGGAGKTRLAQQSAAETLDRFPQGVWFVALEALTEPALIPQAVAAAVGLREQPGHSLTGTLCEMLRSQQTLLILDNCEHLIDACARFAQTVLQVCPFVRILATSREPLVISGEACYAVPTLSVGPSRSVAAEEPSEAVRLFVERAMSSLPSFALTPQNSAAVMRICRRLDGIPLALELAAPRVRLLTPEQIVQRLDRRLRLLTGGSRVAPSRQQTMLATIQWSHDLLTDRERLLFRRLSIFAGGWTLDATEKVCAGDDLEDYEVFDLLSSLVAKSLVQSDEQEGGEHRYRLLETLREYSLERLAAHPDWEQTREKHQAYFLTLTEQAEVGLRGPDQRLWLSRIEVEHDNLRAVLARPTQPEVRHRIAAALPHFWLMRGHLSEGRNWLESALERGGASDIVTAKTLSAAGVLAWSQAEYATARGFQQRALATYRECGDGNGIAKTLLNLGIVADYERDFATAFSHYTASLEYYRTLGDARHTALTLLNIAAHLIDQDLHADAAPFLEESLSLLRQQDDHTSIATVYYDQGQVAYKHQSWEEADAKFRESLSIREGLQDLQGIASCLFYMACLDDAVGRYERSACLLSAAQAIRARIHIPLRGFECDEYERLTVELAARLGPDVYGDAWIRGETMDAAAAVRCALHDG